MKLSSSFLFIVILVLVKASLAQDMHIDQIADSSSDISEIGLRLSAADGNDTFSYETGLLGIDFHYEIDTEGSRTEFSK